MLHAIQSQKQHAKILPHQIQMLNFFQLTKQEIEQKLSEEMIVNPFLDSRRACLTCESSSGCATASSDWVDRRRSGKVQRCQLKGLSPCE